MMDDNRLKELAKEEKDRMSVPEPVHAALEETLDSLPERTAEVVPLKRHRGRWAASIAAAFLLVCMVLPNTGYPVARALGNLPVIGTVFQAVTFREYSEETANLEIRVITPEIEAEGKTGAANAVSAEIADLNEAAVAQFKKEHVTCGVGSLNIYYDVVADTDRWFTVRVTSEESGADTVTMSDSYTFDKTTGESVILSDLFETDAYIALLSENVKEQMRAQMKAGTADYFLDTDMPEEDFSAIDPNQDFCFDEKGRLVLCFDEMEVAPASEGTVTFTIPQKVFQSDLKPEYK